MEAKMSISTSGRRKKAPLHRSGGSRAVVIPKDWLERQGITSDQVELVETDFGIVIQRCREESPSIEDEPEFALFLEFMVKRAFRQPEQLVNVAEMTAGDEELVR